MHTPGNNKRSVEINQIVLDIYSSCLAKAQKSMLPHATGYPSLVLPSQACAVAMQYWCTLTSATAVLTGPLRIQSILLDYTTITHIVLKVQQLDIPFSDYTIIQ